MTCVNNKDKMEINQIQGELVVVVPSLVILVPLGRVSWRKSNQGWLQTQYYSVEAEDEPL